MCQSLGLLHIFFLVLRTAFHGMHLCLQLRKLHLRRLCNLIKAGLKFGNRIGVQVHVLLMLKFMFSVRITTSNKDEENANQLNEIESTEMGPTWISPKYAMSI